MSSKNPVPHVSMAPTFGLSQLGLIDCPNQLWDDGPVWVGPLKILMWNRFSFPVVPSCSESFIGQMFPSLAAIECQYHTFLA